ncbi:hypothetical protein BDK51DRAFT_30315, partial [Blyttiomyces helicus]
MDHLSKNVLPSFLKKKEFRPIEEFLKQINLVVGIPKWSLSNNGGKFSSKEMEPMWAVLCINLTSLYLCDLSQRRTTLGEFDIIGVNQSTNMEEALLSVNVDPPIWSKILPEMLTSPQRYSPCLTQADAYHRKEEDENGRSLDHRIQGQDQRPESYAGDISASVYPPVSICQVPQDVNQDHIVAILQTQARAHIVPKKVSMKRLADYNKWFWETLKMMRKLVQPGRKERIAYIADLTGAEEAACYIHHQIMFQLLCILLQCSPKISLAEELPTSHSNSEQCGLQITFAEDLCT